MNNASKGRCVTVTPRGKTEDETLKAKPELGKRESQTPPEADAGILSGVSAR